MTTYQQTLTTFRDTIRRVSPVWLRGPIGERVLYALAIQVDAMADGLVAAVKLRFPGLQSYEGLPLIGRERRIRRGRFESEATYASRLRPWLDHHRKRGGPYALLEQLRAYFAPNGFRIELRYASGRRFVMAADGTITRDVVTWTPPGDAARWARWWLYYDWPNPVDNDGLWGDPGVWGDGGVWGSNLAPQDVRDLRMIPREWGNAHSTGRLELRSPLKTVNFAVQGA